MEQENNSGGCNLKTLTKGYNYVEGRMQKYKKDSEFWKGKFAVVKHENNKLRSFAHRLSKKSSETDNLFRELVMRQSLAFPENQFDLVHHEQGMNFGTREEKIIFLEKIMEVLKLDISEHEEPKVVDGWIILTKDHKPTFLYVKFKDKYGNEFIGNYGKESGLFYAYGLNEPIQNVTHYQNRTK